MESRMDRNSVESRSGDATSIFAQSIDVRRPGRSRRRATKKNLSPEIEQQATPGAERRHQRRAVVELERARSGFELSRATTMANELEHRIEQAHAKASSHRSGIQGTRANGSASIRRKKGLVDVDVEALDGDQSDTVYAEVIRELDRVKRELRKLQREVRSAREAIAHAERDAQTPTPGPVMRTDSCVPDSGVEREAVGENEECVIAELAEAGGHDKRMQTQATCTRAKEIIRTDTSRTSDTTEGTFATASSSDVQDEEFAAPTTAQHEEHDDASPLPAAAEAELDSARTELASVKEEAIQFTNATIDRTRAETARVAEEIGRIREQEEKAGAQVRQLNAKLLRARSRLAAATADDERADATLAELASEMRRVGEETGAAEKENAVAEVEAQRVGEEVENVGAAAAAAERRVRRAVREFEAARAAEAAATARLKAAVDSAVMARAAVTSGNVTIARFEYEYLTGRAEVVRAAAEKKVAAAEAWVEALRAGEKEIAMRAEAIEKEIGEAKAGGEAEGCDSSQQRAPRRRAAAPREREAPAASRRTRTPSASVARKPTPPSFEIEKKRKARVQSSCLKVIAGKCGGRS